MIKVEDVYPITRRKEPDNDQEYVFITDEDLKNYTPPAKLDSLMRQLTGQTRYMWGIYPGDVEAWLNKRPNTD